MSDIIHLLPDSIANQIAAGEVIQRPASVVKELVENSLDAGARQIQLIIKDAGRTLVQVVDDGKGMSETDARMAFERHATSKIKNADDLFALHTRGFRGEALASIAAIAHVEVQSRQPESEVGTLIKIAGSVVESQEMISCAVGTNIAVKNIFYNVPARRKFLKSNETERRNIIQELTRIAMVNPDVEFILIENDVQTMHLPAANLRQRIVQIEGKNINQQLIEIEESTSMAKIYGYVSMPKYARKRRGSQYFFANNRFIRHPYFHRAVMSAFESLIMPGEHPSYFIYFDVDPSAIDVNIHPTKTEVKFENEPAIWQILMVIIKESLGRSNAVPSIDFDTVDAPDIPIFDSGKDVGMPQVKVNPGYNPFKVATSAPSPAQSRERWEAMGGAFEQHAAMPEFPDEPEESELLFISDGGSGIDSTSRASAEHYQYKQRYILTSVKSGLMMIDQHRAHVRILFDKYLEQVRNRKGVSQRTLFPELIELNAEETSALRDIMEDLEALGFELADEGNYSYSIMGVPAELNNVQFAHLIHACIDESTNTGNDVKEKIYERLALTMARFAAITAGKTLSDEEMLLLVSQLFACSTPNYTPDGKLIISVISDEEIESKMK